MTLKLKFLIFSVLLSVSVQAQNGAYNLVSGGSSVKTTPVTRELLLKTTTEEIKSFLDISGGGSVNATNFIAYSSVTIGHTADSDSASLVLYSSLGSAIFSVSGADGDLYIDVPSGKTSTSIFRAGLLVAGEAVTSYEANNTVSGSANQGMALQSIEAVPNATAYAYKKRTYIFDCSTSVATGGGNDFVGFEFPPSIDGVYIFDITLIGRASSGDACLYRRSLAVRNLGPTVVLFGTISETYTATDSEEFGLTINISGMALFLTVTSGTFAEASWHCMMDVQFVEF